MMRFGMGVAVWLCCLAVGCGTADEGRDGAQTGGAAGVAGAAAAGGVGGPTGGGAAVGATGGDGMAGIDGGDPLLCGGTTVEPNVIEVEVMVEVTVAEPIALNIMLDQSMSMALGGLWAPAVQAITDFVNDPKSTNVDVALSLFPAQMGFIPGGGDECAAATYVPTVPLGRLPAHAPAIVAGLPMAPPGFSTPIEGALRGATEFCKNFVPADPADAGEKCIVLFITDGAPSACAEDTPTIVSVTQNASVPVYTIALAGADLNLLDMIASSTGTTCGGATPSCDLTAGGSFVDALNAIRDAVVTVETHIETQIQALPCEWLIPEPDPGKSFLKEEVNVLFSTAPGVDGAPFVNVADMAACAGNAGAWYYDNADAPTQIHACPDTCTVLEATETGNVEIQLGCPIVKLD